MTLLNTVSNMGSQWPGPLFLKLLGYLSPKVCVLATADNDDTQGDTALDLASELRHLPCADAAVRQGCAEAGGTCEALADHTTLIVLVSLVAGAVWTAATWRLLRSLQRRPLSDWRCSSGRGQGYTPVASTSPSEPCEREEGLSYR